MSLTSARLCHLMANAHSTGSITDMRSAFNEWQTCNCYHPVRVRIFDAHTQTPRFINVPCGKCYHCQETKINEWVTRMYAHAEYFKHVYFITLTYRSLTTIGELEALLLNKLCDAVWHRDSHNSTHRLSYNPCVLSKSHYQNFFKRLRKNTGIKDLSYVVSGEYGKQFGRPHFHAVLFSNSPISREDIVRAWSVCLWRDNNGRWSFRRNQKYNGAAYNFPIGRVDFHDLVSNGSFNTTAKVRVDNSFMSAGNCFAYVCKYVCKRENPTLSRVKLAYNSLFLKQKYIKIFNDDIRLDLAHDHLLKLGYSANDIPSIINNLNSFIYEKVLFSPRSSVYADSLKPVKEITLPGSTLSFEVLPSNYYDFRDSFAPFVEFSRGSAIGSLYADSHLQEFKDGVFNKPILQNNGFVVPSYFRRKAAESLFPIRVMRKTSAGTSYALGGLVDRDRQFRSFLQSGIQLSSNIPYWKTSLPYESLLQNPHFVWRDASSGERILTFNGRAQYFKYDRSSCSYKTTKIVPLADWIRQQVSLLFDEFARHRDKLSRIETSERFLDNAFLIAGDFNVNYADLRDEFEVAQTAFLSRRQFDYDLLHKSVE